MSSSVQFRLALGISIVIVLSVGFALVATSEATRFTLKEQGTEDLKMAISDISTTFDMNLTVISDQIQAAAADPVLKSRLLELAPIDQPPGLDTDEQEKNLIEANRYFQSNQPAMFARQKLVAVCDSARRLVYISTRPDRSGPLVFPGLLVQADTQNLGVAIPALKELPILAAASDLLDKSMAGYLFVAAPIFSAERKIGYIIIGNPILNLIQSWERRLRLTSAIRVGSERFFPEALAEARGDIVRVDGKLSVGEVQIERDLSYQIGPLLDRLRKALLWALPFNWAIGLIVVVLLSRKLIRNRDQNKDVHSSNQD